MHDVVPEKRCYRLLRALPAMLSGPALMVLSAVLVALSFPPLAWQPCAVVAWVPFFIALRECSPRRAFYLGFCHGMLVYGYLLSWFWLIFRHGAVGLFALLAVFTGLFALLFRSAAGRVKSPWLLAPVAGVIWTAVEFYRCELFVLRFAWLTPGMALGANWLTPWVGVYGVSLLVVLGSVLLAVRATREAGALLASALLALGFFGMPKVKPSGDTVRVAAIQAEDGTLDDYVRMTRRISRRRAQLVVWPEYAIPYDIRRADVTKLDRIRELAQRMDGLVVFGTKTRPESKPSRWYNTALAVDGAGVVGEYYKMQPVHFFDDGEPGRLAEPIATSLGRMGTPICFDFDYTSIMRRMTANGAEFFAVPSYDATYWSLKQHLQHSAMLPVRAAETGRWIVCAASSGISQIIDPHGREHSRIEPMTTGVTTGEIGRIGQLTFYVRFGWLLPWFCLVGTVVSFCWAQVEKARKRSRRATPGAVRLP